MSRLIDADALIPDFLEPTTTNNTPCKRYVSMEQIHNAPTIEPQIIRCRECKFYTAMQRDLNIGICALTCQHLGDNGFCSNAERREECDI